MSADTAVRTRSSPLAGWLASPPPSVAIEIAPSHVTVLALAESGRDAVISGYAIEPLAAGVVTATLNAPNVHDQGALVATITTALQKVAARARRVALVVPDTTAKVSLVRFEKVPAKAQDLDQLIHWQVKKAAPFRVEDAQVSWVPGVAIDGGGREFVVSMARRDVIQSFERACEAAGVHAGIVDIASFSLINAQLAAAGTAGGDWLLVHVGHDYATLAVVRGSDLVFFRNRTLGAEGDLADLVHQTAMYHEDRLGGGGFSRVVLAGASMAGAEQAERLRRGAEERLGGRVEVLDVRNAATLRDRIGASPALLDALAAPVGVLLRERAGARRGRGVSPETVGA
jgi:type IV pilus assembly protein PilM